MQNMLPPKLSGYIRTLCFNSSARIVSIGPPKVLTIFSKSSHAVLQQIKVFPENKSNYNQQRDTLQQVYIEKEFYNILV